MPTQARKERPRRSRDGAKGVGGGTGVGVDVGLAVGVGTSVGKGVSVGSGVGTGNPVGVNTSGVTGFGVFGNTVAPCPPQAVPTAISAMRTPQITWAFFMLSLSDPILPEEASPLIC